MPATMCWRLVLALAAAAPGVHGHVNQRDPNGVAVSGIQCWQPEPPKTMGNTRLTFGVGAAMPPHPRLRVNDVQLAVLQGPF